jgi:hypothetical protein
MIDTGKYPQESGFAGSVVPDQGETVARLKIEINIPESLDNSNG